jgi:manganese transport protein
VLSLQLGFAIIPLIHFTSDKEKMGVFAIKPWVQIAAWAIAIIIVSLNAKLVTQEISGWLIMAEDKAWIVWLTAIPICLGAAILLLYISFKPWLDRRRSEKTARAPHGSATELISLDKTPYQQIAVTIDFSSIDSLTIRSAVSQGGKNARYLLVHVVETVGAMWYGSEIADHESSADTAALKSYAMQLKEQGYQAEIKIGFGNPKLVIPEIVNEFDADLLVMGAHGHKWVKDLIFGTTVDTVRHRVKIPVLIVREPLE